MLLALLAALALVAVALAVRRSGVDGRTVVSGWGLNCRPVSQVETNEAWASATVLTPRLPGEHSDYAGVTYNSLPKIARMMATAEALDKLKSECENPPYANASRLSGSCQAGCEDVPGSARCGIEDEQGGYVGRLYRWMLPPSRYPHPSADWGKRLGIDLHKLATCTVDRERGEVVSSQGGKRGRLTVMVVCEAPCTCSKRCRPDTSPLPSDTWLGMPLWRRP